MTGDVNAMTAAAQGSQTSTGEGKKSLPSWLILSLIVVAGFSLRLYHIGNHGLFVDEVYSVLIATGKADPELADFDAARPLYFLLLKMWLMVSSSESWMRFLSVIFGTANIALTYKMGKTFCDRKVGLAAAMLMALSPMEVHYSQQVRMYTMGTTLVLCGTLALFRAYAETSKKWLAAWVVSRLLMVLTLPLTGMLLLSDWLYAFDRRKDSIKLPAIAIGTAAIFAVWSPFIYITIMAHASEYDMWRATLDPPTAFDLFTLLINFTATAVPLQESGGPPAFDVFTWAYLVTFPVVLGAAIAFCHKQAKMLWCCAYGLLPLGLIFVWSNIDACLLITRYTMFTGPFFMILLAYGWAEISSRSKPAGLGIAGVYALAMTSCLNFFYTHPVHEDWKPVADYLAAHAKPGEEIVVWNYHSRYLMGYYFHGPNRVTDLRIISKHEPGDDPDTPVARIQFMDIKPKSGQHIWIVSREAAAGWTTMHEVYCKYQQEVEQKFKVLHHEHLIMTDVYEVEVP